MALFNLGYSVGFSVALLADFAASDEPDAPESWRALGAFCAVPPVALIGLMLMLPESEVSRHAA